MSVLDLIPYVAVFGAVVATIIVVVFNLYQKYAPAADGIPLGYLEVEGRYAGGKLLKRIKGTLVDASSLFINPELAVKVKAMILGEMTRRAKNPDEAKFKEQFAEFKKKVDEAPLDKFCRVIVTRASEHGGFKKHVFLQWEHVSQPLNAYAHHEPESKFSLGFGFQSKGIVTGVLNTCGKDWDIPQIGKATVHFFVPDVSEAEKKGENDISDDAYKNIARFALYGVASIDMHEQVKFLEAEVKQDQKEKQELGRELSARSRELNEYKTLVKKMSPNEKFPKNAFGSKFDVLDLILFFIFGITGVLLAPQGGVEPVVGVIFGMLGAGVIVFKRR